VNDVVRGLRRALVVLVSSAVVALAVAGLWATLQGGGFRVRFAVTLMVIAGLLSLTGGTAFSRAATNDERAFLAWGPEPEEPDTGPGLTGLGLFLFVSLPLFVAGSVLYGYG